jgi:hypothetical protein
MTDQPLQSTILRRVGNVGPAAAVGEGDLEVVAGWVEVASTTKATLTPGTVVATEATRTRGVSTSSGAVGAGLSAGRGTTQAAVEAGSDAVEDTGSALAVSRGGHDNAVRVDNPGDVISTALILTGVLRNGGKLEDGLVKHPVCERRVLESWAAPSFCETSGDGDVDGLAGANIHSDESGGLDAEHGRVIPAEDGSILVRIVGEGHLGYAAIADPDLVVGRGGVVGLCTAERLKDVAAAAGAWRLGRLRRRCRVGLAGLRGGGLVGAGLGSSGRRSVRGLRVGRGSYVGDSRSVGRGWLAAVVFCPDGVPLILGDVGGLDGSIVVDGVANDLVPLDGLGTRRGTAGWVSTRMHQCLTLSYVRAAASVEAGVAVVGGGGLADGEGAQHQSILVTHVDKFDGSAKMCTECVS